MISVNSGLGFLIVDARNAGNRYDLVVAGMVMIGAIGLLLDLGNEIAGTNKVIPLEFLGGLVASKEAVLTEPGAGLKLRVEHLGMVYERDGESVAALEDINLDVSEGEFICICLWSFRLRQVHTSERFGRLSLFSKRLGNH